MLKDYNYDLIQSNNFEWQVKLIGEKSLLKLLKYYERYLDQSRLIVNE